MRRTLPRLTAVLGCSLLTLAGCGGGSEPTDGAATEAPANESSTSEAASAPAEETPPATTEEPAAPAADSPAEEQPVVLTSLQERIDELKAGSKIPDDVRQVFVAGIQEVRDSGIEASALQAGAQSIDFELPNATGNPIRLSDLYAKGPVVLTWYRGGWCPYCNLSLRAMQEVLPQIQSAGGTLVAVTPETPDNSLTTTEKNELEFIVLSDAGNEVAREYGLVFKLSEAVSPLYKQFGIDLAATNGDDSDELPLAATYVIDAAGKVRWAFLDADYTKRAEPADVVEALKAL